MTPGKARRSRVALVVALVVVLSISFAVLAHVAIVDGVSPTVGALLSLLPLAGFALWMLRRSRHRGLALAVLAAALAALWFGWGSLKENFPSLFFLEHAGVNLLLALAFGRTLVGGREPLCARFARMIHGPLEADVARYARRVTIAWTIFFTTLFALSCTLYLGHFLAAWSILANILSPILVAAMFGAEYAIRVRALPHHERVGILGGIRAFSRHFGAARFEAPR